MIIFMLIIIVVYLIISLCFSYIYDFLYKEKEIIKYTYNDYKQLIDNRINNYFTNRDNEIEACCHYATKRGKRIRPIIILEIIRMNNKNPKDYIDQALSLEFIHNASLIMDDLPEQDNDESRRGLESSWKKYGKSTAQLASVYLMAKSIENCTDYSEQMKYLSKYLKDAAEGQYLDLTFSSAQCAEENVNNILKLKTASLFEAATVSGCILSNKKKDLKKYMELGNNLGMAYQIADDIGDIEKDDNVNYAKIKGLNVAYFDLSKYITNIRNNIKELKIESIVWDEIIEVIQKMCTS